MAQLIGVGFVILTMIYAGLSLFSRSVRRAKLRAKWANGKRLADRDKFVKRGLERYDRSIRRKLILGVYVVPVAVIGLIIYLTNFS